jgi:hypothetical protein
MMAGWLKPQAFHSIAASRQARINEPSWSGCAVMLPDRLS